MREQADAERDGIYVTDHARLLKRASQSMSSTPRSYLRWAGSKRRLAVQIVPHLPPTFGHYFEPFMGSASMFFLLAPTKATLGDTSDELVDTAQCVAHAPESVIESALALSMDKGTYYKVRAKRSAECCTRAGEMLYLNRGCFNGLYRVNAGGAFNVPWGAPKTGYVLDKDNISACSELLSQPAVSVEAADFAVRLTSVVPGDLVFLDPPYVTTAERNTFADYNEKLFSWADQERLASIANDLAQSGAHVIVTNANYPEVTSLYRGFTSISMFRHSTLAGNPEKRTATSEALLVCTHS
jgi:DNA adenine methylase